MLWSELSTTYYTGGNHEFCSQLIRSFDGAILVEGRQLQGEPGAEGPRCGFDGGEQGSRIRPLPFGDFSRGGVEVARDRGGVDRADLALDDSAGIDRPVPEVGEHEREILD